MNYFLDTDFSEDNLLLNAEESKHALKSLRLSSGDELFVGNGNGIRFRCQLAGTDGNLARLNIIEKIGFELPKNRLSIAISPTKNPARYEWFLEKATELGVSQIIPVITRHSERPRINEKRSQKIVHAASKQSQRFYIPRLWPMFKLKELDTSAYQHLFVAHCNTNFSRREFSQTISKLSGNTLVLIGPEGDFSREEIDALQDQNFQGVSLGKQRLRTETAGVYTAAVYSSSIHLLP